MINIGSGMFLTESGSAVIYTHDAITVFDNSYSG